MMSLYEQFMTTHLDQLTDCGLPQLYWKTLYEKLKFEIFDADESFNVVKEVYTGTAKSGFNSQRDTFVSEQNGISCQDAEKVFLIDHVWTFSLLDAHTQLQAVPGLLDRVATIIGLEQINEEEKIDLTMQHIWKFCHHCSVQDPETSTLISVWYLWDEFGSGIQHGIPNVMIRPFYFIDSQTTYSIMWPIKDIPHNGQVLRDCLSHLLLDNDHRQAFAVPWTNEQLKISDAYTIIDDKHFTDGVGLPTDVEKLSFPTQHPLKVYTDLKLLQEFLTDSKYLFVDNEDEADILYLSYHIKDYTKFSKFNTAKWINQFPCECIVTSKDLLAITCRSDDRGKDGEYGITPDWLPVTYLLQKELPQFVAHYQKRAKRYENNIWICKPWNLARGMDTTVTDNLNQIIRLAETAPKVVCKYIHDPVLYTFTDLGPVKFDIRYVILLSSVRPLVLHAHKIFWLRFANKVYSLDDFFDYDKHFTVMNYQDGKKLRQVHLQEFCRQFEAQNPKYPWKDVEQQILFMIRSVFERATRQQPPRAIFNYPQSRALYAVDLMLAWKRNEAGDTIGIQPQICEVNFSPDNVRACRYHPNFYNQVFNLLFFSQAPPEHFHDISP